ncbi:MAG: hypothetical protein Kow0090_17130 [Myxococcota bacterium]
MKSNKLLFVPLLALLFGLSNSAQPFGRYSLDGSNTIWFIQITDSHIDNVLADYEEDNFQWVLGEAAAIINPYFIVNTGDLTDSTSDKLPYYGVGPIEDEWKRYRGFLDATKISPDFYFDIPGNHDAYNDGGLKFYLKYSLQGSTTGRTQHSWRIDTPTQSFHFFNGADPANDGKQWPSDNAEFTDGELDEVKSFLATNGDAEFQMAFTHHPLKNVKNYEKFREIMINNSANYYACGHAHDYVVEIDDYDVVQTRINSLGQSKENNFAIWAVDNNCVTMTVFNARSAFPLVVITAPADTFIGPGDTELNPHIPTISRNCAKSPVRALVFDSGIINSIGFQIDGGAWEDMYQRESNPYQWRGYFDATKLAAGKHEITVQATGLTPGSSKNQFLVDDIPCELGEEDPDEPIISDDDDDIIADDDDNDDNDDVPVDDDDDSDDVPVDDDDDRALDVGGDDDNTIEEDGGIEDGGEDEGGREEGGDVETPEALEDTDAEEREEEEKDNQDAKKEGKVSEIGVEEEEGCACRVR